MKHVTLSVVVLVAAFSLGIGGAKAAAVDEGWTAIWPKGKMPDPQPHQQVEPAIKWFSPEAERSDVCLIVAPGGSYNGWCYSHEGAQVATNFIKQGITVAVLRYRTPRPVGLPKHVTAWQDAQRAVRVVRSEAATRGFAPDKIGFCGFSAGGHLALMAATSSMTQSYAPIDELDKNPCNVNFAILVYPAYVLSDGFDGQNTTKGNIPGLELAPEFAFDAKTPPMCFFHGDEDLYSPMGSINLYVKLRRMGIAGELNVFSGLGHGFGASRGDRGWAWIWNGWECTAVKWLKQIRLK